MSEHVSRSGRVYIRHESNLAVTISRYPSIGYFERVLTDENKGNRIREWVRE